MHERDSHKHDHIYKQYMSMLMRGILISTIIQAVYERVYERDSHISTLTHI